MNKKMTDVMTVDEVAKYLRVPRSSLYKLAQESKIPCQKVGRHWRFRKEAIDRWLEENRATLPPDRWPGEAQARQTKKLVQIRALKGKYAFVSTSSEDFALRKQEEIRQER